MKKLIVISVAILAFSSGVIAFYVFKSINILSTNSSELKNFHNTLEFNVSNLKVGETASFRAVLVKTPGTNCIELFNPVDYKKYNGDPLWAATAKLANEPKSMFFSWLKKEVTVSGKMIRVLNSENPRKTCGIVTGEIFEITSLSDD